MGRKVQYRLVVVRPDGSREIIVTRIPQSKATTMRQFLDSREQASKLVVEPETKPERPSGL